MMFRQELTRPKLLQQLSLERELQGNLLTQRGAAAASFFIAQT